jgi:uncharacterized protein YndB with AHSA1/START domain
MRSLRCTAERAFATYVKRIGEWWDPRYTSSPTTLLSVVIEPRVGGRVYAKHSDAGDHDWGSVTVWEPGRRLVYTFTLAQDPRYPSEVMVEFAGVGSRSSIRLAHGGWTSENSGARTKFSDWPGILDRFAALAEAG